MPPALPPRTAMRCGVDVAPRREVQRRIEAVLRVGDAPLAPERAAIGPPVPRAARVVDARHGEATGREELEGQVEPGLAGRRRAPVAPRHQRGRLRPAGPSVPAERRPVQRPVDGATRTPRQREGLARRRRRRARGRGRGRRAQRAAPAHPASTPRRSAGHPACCRSAPARPRARRARAIDTHGCSTRVPAGRRAGPSPVQPDEQASRPDAVMRATSVPSARSAIVACPRTQSGPWNSAAAVGERPSPPPRRRASPACT